MDVQEYKNMREESRKKAIFEEQGYNVKPKENRKLKRKWREDVKRETWDERNEDFPFVIKKRNMANQLFPFGNCHNYYSDRVGKKKDEDPRLNTFQKQWFQHKDVLDIGCNEGYITITLAQKYRVTSMYGIDIDPALIEMAWQHLENEASIATTPVLPQYTQFKGNEEYREFDVENLESEEEKDVFFDARESFDESTDSSCSDGDLEERRRGCNELGCFPELERGLCGNELLERVGFERKNFLKCEVKRHSIDTVLCLSVAKWVHLNWGDEGLMQLFAKIHCALRPGGVLVFEPQSWASYRAKQTFTERLRDNYLSMVIRPWHFKEILLDEIGFESCEEIVRKVPGCRKGFDWPIFVYTKKR